MPWGLGRLEWSWNRPVAAALATAALVGLLAAVPAPLVPLATGYRNLCDRFPVLAQLTNHLPPLPMALLLSLVIVALVKGGVVGVPQLVRAHRFNRRLAGLGRPAPPRLVRAARRLGLHGRLTYLDDPGLLACCYGFLKPRVAVTAALVARLDDEELLAALAHERHHLRRRDPARYLAIRVLAATAFMFPVAAAFGRLLETRLEVAADRAALAVAPRGALAGALLTVLSGPRLPSAGAAELSATEARIAHLADAPVLPPIPIGTAVASLAVLLVTVAAVVDLAASTHLIEMFCPFCRRV